MNKIYFILITVAAGIVVLYLSFNSPTQSISSSPQQKSSAKNTEVDKTSEPAHPQSKPTDTSGSSEQHTAKVPKKNVKEPSGDYILRQGLIAMEQDVPTRRAISKRLENEFTIKEGLEGLE